MKNFVKNYWKHLLLFALAGLVGGFLAGLDLLASYPEEIQAQILAQGMNETMLAIVTGVQYAGYGLVLGILGIILAKKIGLWNDSLALKPKPLAITVFLFVICGILFIGIDYYVFGRLIPPVADSYLVKPTAATILGAIILGVARPAGAEFSFFLAIPTMLGASALKLLKFLLSGVMASGTEILLLVIGCAVSFIVSLLAIRALMDYVRRNSFRVFGIYRIILGGVVLAWFILQQVM